MFIRRQVTVSIWMHFFDEIHDYIEVRGGLDFRPWIDVLSYLPQSSYIARTIASTLVSRTTGWQNNIAKRFDWHLHLRLLVSRSWEWPYCRHSPFLKRHLLMKFFYNNTGFYNIRSILSLTFGVLQLKEHTIEIYS